jgi:hypothetical protein
LFANKKFADLHSLTPEQMIGRLINDMMPSENDINQYITRDQEVIRSGKAIVIPEISFIPNFALG